MKLFKLGHSQNIKQSDGLVEKRAVGKVLVRYDMVKYDMVRLCYSLAGSAKVCQSPLKGGVTQVAAGSGFWFSEVAAIKV